MFRKNVPKNVNLALQALIQNMFELTNNYVEVNFADKKY